MGKYEEALERAKEIYNAPVATIVTRTFLEQIFPELKESEEERIRRDIVAAVEMYGDFTQSRKEEIYAYLEKQKDKVVEFDHDKEQKPAEWSEEDGLARDFLLKQTEQYIKVLESLSTEKYIGKKGIVDVASELSNWKNARSFILSLHPHWKPSEEQMQYLLAVINDPNNAGAESCHLILESLYEQLKRL